MSLLSLIGDAGNITNNHYNTNIESQQQYHYLFMGTLSTN